MNTCSCCKKKISYKRKWCSSCRNELSWIKKCKYKRKRNLGYLVESINSSWQENAIKIWENM
jgi:predicted amidophosphoribosyltransferase